MCTSGKRNGLVLGLAVVVCLVSVDHARAQGRCGGRQTGQSSLQALTAARYQQGLLQSQLGSPYTLQALQQYQLQAAYGQNAYLNQLLAQQYGLQLQLLAYQQAALQQSYRPASSTRGQRRQANPPIVLDDQ